MFVCFESSESVASLAGACRRLILKLGDSCSYISAYMLLMANTKLIKECYGYLAFTIPYYINPIFDIYFTDFSVTIVSSICRQQLGQLKINQLSAL